MKKLPDMKFHKIDLRVLVQIFLLAATPILFSMSLNNSSLIITRASLVIIWVVQIILLYRYLKQSDRKLKQAVKIISSGEEFQLLRNKELSFVHEDVLKDINEAITKFRSLKIEREADLLFFQLVMEYIPAGVIVIGSSEKIRLVNRAALDLLGIEFLENLERLETVKAGLSNWFMSLTENVFAILDLDFPDHSYRISVSVRDIKLLNSTQRIYLLKDIKKEVDIKEVETWHNMLSILSHEVVNSVSPITLSSKGMQRNITELRKVIDKNESTDKIISEIETGLSLISTRGTGLNEFVESINKLTKIPSPVYEDVSLGQLIKESAGLMHEDFQTKNVEISTSNEDMKVFCDKKLIVHVMINLLRNSIEAFTNELDKTISISGKKEDNHTIIQVTDSGPGIPSNIKNQIFSPFFSTKKRGSGLGLSFTRQVMRRHNGDVNIWTTPGKTIFTLTFQDKLNV
ncbi:MAG: GHKL domain-containing protein [Bacteroidia bacterium]|nr:MAG: GHKL domain-containing protein [Bacteroidia bacterium]